MQRLVFGGQLLDLGQVLAVLGRLDLRCLRLDPRQNRVSVPRDLQKARDVVQLGRPADHRGVQVGHVLPGGLGGLGHLGGRAVLGGDQLARLRPEDLDAVVVALAVHLENAVLPTERLGRRQRGRHRRLLEQRPLLGDPGLFVRCLGDKDLRRDLLVEQLGPPRRRGLEVGPRRRQLGRGLFDGLAVVVLRHHQRLGLRKHLLHKGAVGAELKAESCMLLYQALHRSKVAAKVRRRRDPQLLLDPRLLVVDVPEQLMQLLRLLEVVGPRGGGLFNSGVSAHNGSATIRDSGGVKVPARHQVVGRLLEPRNGARVVGHVRDHRDVLLDERLHREQILTEVLVPGEPLDRREPQLNVLGRQVVLLPLPSLAQLERLGG
mmetsp:Transcript_36245/g.108783  ORF Transcript_36245/g.108783 Transcript_36245/m.108783 type:complete len:376 (+) Transcript_36245:1376-2503(+)